MKKTILKAIDDKNLFAPWFKNRTSWAAWRAFLAALFGLPMTPDQLAVYQQCTGRTAPPTARATEGWLVCGRRAGKSFNLALIAVYLATFYDYRKFLTLGERASIMVIASDRKQSRVILRYIRALLKNIPMLAPMIERETAEAFDLDTAVTIEVQSASFKSVRGYSIAAVLCDEMAFWPTEDAAEPDFEVLAALRPGMATIPNAMLLCASSPYARRGVLYDAHRQHYGKEGDPILVWQADTRTMNPTVPQRVIDEALARDPASASAEYMAEFRTDIESFVPLDVVLACVGDFTERAPLTTHAPYFAFCDPSGGSADSFTLAISHREDGKVIIDAVRDVRPPFSPEAVINDFSVLIRSYGCGRVVGDRYAGEFPRELFRKKGVHYAVSEKPKSDLYLDLLPLLNSTRIVLPRSDRVVSQITGLERQTARSGKDSIDHSPRSHDDLANAIAGAASLALLADRHAQPLPVMSYWSRTRHRDEPSEVRRRIEEEMREHIPPCLIDFNQRKQSNG